MRTQQLLNLPASAGLAAIAESHPNLGRRHGPRHTRICLGGNPWVPMCHTVVQNRSLRWLACFLLVPLKLNSTNRGFEIHCEKHSFREGHGPGLKRKLNGSKPGPLPRLFPANRTMSYEAAWRLPPLGTELSAHFARAWPQVSVALPSE